MKLLDLTLPEPAANLAADEALLDLCEDGAGPVLRFYQPTTSFVVVGYGNKITSEVDSAACAAAGIPVLRRVSGGGTVLLGPGCLAYALVLPISFAPELETVGGTNAWVMERNRAALERAVGSIVRIRGYTDLTLGELKFSGNAQRRRRASILFHGTFLLDADLAAIGRLLRMPTLEPDYRVGRGHEAFLTNLGIGADLVRLELARAWGAAETWSVSLEEPMVKLMHERYGRRDWHERC